MTHLSAVSTSHGSDEGRKFSNEGFKDAEGVHEKASTETELFIQEITPTEVIHEQEGSGKASDEISTWLSKKKDTASEAVPPVISTAEVQRQYCWRNGLLTKKKCREKKDKGKGIEEIEHENKRAQIARDSEICQTMGSKRKRKKLDEAESTKKIRLAMDPSVLRYHSLKMKPKSIAHARVRPIYLKAYADFNQKFVPLDAEKASKKQKSPEKERSPEKIMKEKVVTQEKKEEVPKEPTAKRKKSIPRKTTRKRQKLEDVEKDELKGFLDVVPREETPIEIESLSTKFPIVDWKTVVLTETFMLVKERYSSSAPEGFDLMLWGDLHTLFEPDENDEIWKDQHEYNLLSWRLHDFCGIHILLMNNGLAIHRFSREKKYPLSQEMLSKMLSTRLEVDHESSQAFELLRFIRAQVQK
ncbi:hypothetical protein Tco_0046090 [Tanacetum coccineum]